MVQGVWVAEFRGVRVEGRSPAKESAEFRAWVLWDLGLRV